MFGEKLKGKKNMSVSLVSFRKPLVFLWLTCDFGFLYLKRVYLGYMSAIHWAKIKC